MYVLIVDVLRTHPSEWMQFYFKRIYIFSLDGVVHFFSLVYTGSVLCTENVDLSDVLFSQFLFILVQW